MREYTTLEDVLALSGATYTEAQQDRIEALIPIVSDLIYTVGQSYDKDVDALIQDDSAYESVVNLVTVDVITRVMRETNEGDPMSQMSQSALGYSISGTYAIPGGGISGGLMENDKKRLGFKRQKFGSITLWPQSKE